MSTLSHHPRKPGQRGNVTGWSPGAARRNVAFLRSVVEDDLSGAGLAMTLTLGTLPPAHTDWTKLLNHWTIRQRRAGCVRLHWVMEWQRRGVPHLHVAAWYDPTQTRLVDMSTERALSESLHQDLLSDDHAAHRRAALNAAADWLELAAAFGPRPKGQQIRPIVGASGWFRYLGKHCGRGSDHYQRQQSAMPKAWDRSPRVWGKSGTWPTREPRELLLSLEGFHRLRRLVRRQRVAQARKGLPANGWPKRHPRPTRSEGTKRHNARLRPLSTGGPPARVRLRQLVAARQMLQCPLRPLSTVRGVSEWIAPDAQADLIRAMGASESDLQELVQHVTDAAAAGEPAASASEPGRDCS